MKNLKSKILSIFISILIILSVMPFSALAAPASDIPAEMLDNAFLDALAYTGYNVQAQKNDGSIFIKYTGAVSASIRSNIGYGTGPAGTETISKSGTATGKAPDIAKFEASGLCCASYVSYVYFNFLPNIAGIDTSDITKPTNYRLAAAYDTLASTWVSSGTGRRISFSQSGSTFKPSESIPIGSLVSFKDSSGNIKHVAIYAGAYGGKHFITHVGNENGPEFCTIEGMTKGGTPQTVNQIVTPNFVNPTGIIEVNKKDTDGNDLSGAYFVATSTKDASKQYLIGPTVKGYAKSEYLPYGTYTVKETVFPTNYRSYGQTQWTVTVNSSNKGVVSFNAVNELIPGNIKIVKTSEDDKVNGLEFTISGNGVNKTVQTDNNGEIILKDLKPGEYTVSELVYDTYIPQQSQKITVASGKTATVIFNNELRRGELTITKTAEDGFVENIEFNLKGTSLSGEEVDMFAVSDSEGKAYFKDIPIGTYTVTELNVLEQYVVPEEQNITIEWNTVADITFENKLIRGKVEGNKTDQDGNAIENAEFGLFKSGETEFIKENAINVTTSDETGAFIFDSIPFGKWIIKELSCPEQFVMTDELYEINIAKDGEVLSLGVVNKRVLGIVKVTKLNKADTNQKLSGAEYELYYDADNNGVFDPAIDTLIGELCETETGIYELNNLEYGGYFLYESKAPDKFQKDNRYFYFEIKEDGKTVIVENEKGIGFVNEPIPEPVTDTPTAPKTGDNSKIFLFGFIAIVSFLLMIACAFVLIKKRNKV